MIYVFVYEEFDLSNCTFKNYSCLKINFIRMKTNWSKIKC